MKTVVQMQNTRFGIPPFAAEFTANKIVNGEILLNLGYQFTVQTTALNGFVSCSEHGNSATILRVGEMFAANFVKMQEHLPVPHICGKVDKVDRLGWGELPDITQGTDGPSIV